MSSQYEPSAWISREDGSQWREIMINGAPGIAAILEDLHGRFALTVVCEMPETSQSADDAKARLDQWLLSGGMFATMMQKQG